MRQSITSGRGNIRSGFTLVELLTAIAIIGLLTAILAPALSAARTRARVTAVKLDLREVAKALQAYHAMYQYYPPVRVSCNANMRGHEYQLPVELVECDLMAPGPDIRQMVDMEDQFHPGHSYKYNAPGDAVINGTLTANSNSMWIPDTLPSADGLDTPLDNADGGRRFNNSDQSPVQWAIWSVGPQSDCDKVKSMRAPLSAATWFGPDNTGVICLYLTSQGDMLWGP